MRQPWPSASTNFLSVAKDLLAVVGFCSSATSDAEANEAATATAAASPIMTLSETASLCLEDDDAGDDATEDAGSAVAIIGVEADEMFPVGTEGADEEDGVACT